jgi:hypothetical protein
MDPGSFVPMTGPVYSQSLPEDPTWRVITARQQITLPAQAKAFAIVEVTGSW